MKLPSLVRVVLTYVACLVVAFFSFDPTVAYADDVSFGANQLCGLDTTRPDRQSLIRQQVVHGRNGPIAYVRFGRGTPLLLITGYRATLGEWNGYFLGELARHHDVIVFDNRGVGTSALKADHGDIAYSMHDMAADAADLIASLKLSRVNVVGWSMGGMIAQHLALDAPEKINSMTLITTALPGPDAVPLTPHVQDVLSSSGANAFGQIMGILFPEDARADAMQCFVGDMFKPRGYTAGAVPDTVAAQQNRAMSSWFADRAAVDALRRSPVRTTMSSSMPIRAISND